MSPAAPRAAPGPRKGPSALRADSAPLSQAPTCAQFTSMTWPSVIGVQKTAGAAPKLIEVSARSGEARQVTRPSDRQWQQGHRATAGRLLTPATPRSERAATPDLEAGS